MAGLYKAFFPVAKIYLHYLCQLLKTSAKSVWSHSKLVFHLFLFIWKSIVQPNCQKCLCVNVHVCICKTLDLFVLVYTHVHVIYIYLKYFQLWFFFLTLTFANNMFLVLTRCVYTAKKDPRQWDSERGTTDWDLCYGARNSSVNIRVQAGVWSPKPGKKVGLRAQALAQAWTSILLFLAP